MIQMGLDLSGLPISWRRGIVPDAVTLVCGSVCVGGVYRRTGSWRARVGCLQDSWLLNTYADEAAAMAALEAAVRGEMSGRELEWDDVSCGGVPHQNLCVGEISIARLFPWHAEMPCLPEAYTHRPMSMAAGRRVIEAEARRCITA